MGVACCRLTLLLGPPGSGKTTLLLALAGRLSKELKVCVLISKIHAFVLNCKSSHLICFCLLVFWLNTPGVWQSDLQWA